MSISEKTKKNLLENTGFFEGNKNYSTVTGNGDGQGMSFGIIQFNFGQKTLQPLLKDYINNYEKRFEKIFDDKASEFKKVIYDYSNYEQIKWAKSITSSNGKLESEWSKLFEKLGKDEYNQKLQIKHASSYIKRALSLAKTFDIKTTQGLAFLFDQAVHEWSFKSSISTIKNDVNDYARRYFRRYKENMPEFERLGVILDYVRSNDGKNRRFAIRSGRGYVHGKTYDIDKFHLSYDDKF